MKYSLILSLFLATVALATPSPKDPPKGCEPCEDPICPLELKAVSSASALHTGYLSPSFPLADREPQECECKNAAKISCYKRLKDNQCPGVKPPVLQNCKDIYKTTTTKKSTPTPPPCTCEPVFCVQSFPESCICQNNAAVACAKKCGKPIPPLQDCGTECECPLVNCIQSFPEGCICQNNAAINCAQRCGRPTPPLQDCSVPTTTLKTRRAPKPTQKFQACGVRGITTPCPYGQLCVDNPYVPGCGMACDRPGICVEDKMCGGIAAFPCPKGKTCVDDPRDDCDPKNGGADCSGVCA